MPNQCKNDAWNLNDGSQLNIDSPNRNGIVTTCTPGSSTIGEKPPAYVNDVSVTFETHQAIDSQAIQRAPKRYYVPRNDVSTEKNTREEEAHESYCALTAAVSYDVDTEIRVTVPYSDVENQRRMAKRKRVYADGDSGLAKRAREYRDSMSSDDDTLIMYDVL